MINSMQQDTVRAGDVVETITFDGDFLTHIYSSVEDPVLKQVDTLTQTVAGLRPVFHAAHGTNTAASVRFTDSAAKGWLQLANGDTVVIDTLLQSPFYNAAGFDLIVRATDLRENTRVSLPGFLIYTNSVVPLRGRVTGTEVVDGHPCWVFRGTNGTTPVTFWIDRETHDLRRQLVQVSGGFAFLLTSRPPGEVAHLTDAERDGLVLDATGVRHSGFGFTVAFPSARFAPYEDMQDALRRMLGHRRDTFLWTYHVPGDSLFGVTVLVYKGFDGTQEGFRRFFKEILPSGRTGDEAMFADSIYWDGQRREYRMTSRDKRGITTNTRCIPSPAPRRPGLVVCVLLAGGYPFQIQLVRDGLRFTPSGP